MASLSDGIQQYHDAIRDAMTGPTPEDIGQAIHLGRAASPRSPESTPAALGDLQAMELRIARDHRVLLDRIARLEAQVARIPGFLAAIKEVPRVPE